LLAIASEAFMELGFEGASIEEIARRAGASKQTLYSRYPSKTLLFAAVMTERSDHVLAAFSSMLMKGNNPRKALTDFGSTLQDLVLEKETLALQHVVFSEARRFPELAKTFYDLGPGRAMKLLSSYLRQQSAVGKLNVADPEIAAEQFANLVVGELLRRAALGLGRRTDLAGRRARLKAAVRTFMAAYQE
jgi:TetR/AcrR family transcriptional regulator, mexJK operon transcriptional repressor